MSVDVSIIIPVYNDCNIKRILQSALDQTGDVRFEVIVVDDGSTDDTVKIIDEYCAIDDRFSVIRQENQGVSVARNKGIEAANGEYLVFWDSDDEAPEDAIVSLYKAVSSEFADMAVGKMIVDDCGDRYIQSSVRHLSSLKFISKYDIGFCTNFVLVNKIFRRQLILDNGILFKSFRVEEDGVFLYEYLSKSKKVVGCDCVVYKYLIRPSWEANSLSQGEDKKSLFGRAGALDYIYNYIEENFTDSCEKNTLLSKIANRAVHTSFIGLFYGGIWNAYLSAEADVNKLISRWEGRISEEDWKIIETQYSLYVERRRVMFREKLCENPFFSFAIEPRENKEEVVTILEGLYAQKFPAFELILDEKFRNSYPEICNKANMRFISVNSGNQLEDFRNKALSIARGKYIGYVDEMVLPNRLTIKRIYRQLIKRDIDMISCIIKSTAYGNDALVLHRIISSKGYNKLAESKKKLVSSANNILANRLMKVEVLRDKRVTFSGDTNKDVAAVIKDVDEEIFLRNISFISPITDRYLMDKMNIQRKERDNIVNTYLEAKGVISNSDILELLKPVNTSWDMETVTKVIGEVLDAKTTQIKELENKNKQLKWKVQNIKDSKSYKIGKMIARPVRLLKRM